MIIKKTPSNRKQRLVTTQRTHAGRLKTASFPVVLGDFGRDVICQTSRENITRLARTGRRTRLEGRLTSFRPLGLHSRACFSSAKTTGKWQKKKRKLPNNISENFWNLVRKQFCVYVYVYRQLKKLKRKAMD